MKLRVRSLALLSGLRIRRCRELRCRLQAQLGLDPALLCLWRRPVATAPIRPLAWEPPYAEGAALEKTKNKQTKKKLKTLGVPVVVQWLTNPTRNHEAVG